MVAVNYLWNPLNDNIVREFDDAGAMVAEYTTEPEEFGNVLSQRREDTDSYFHYDGVGSTLAVTDHNSLVVNTQGYTAFGETTEATGTNIFPFQFAGRNGYFRDDLTVEYALRRLYTPAWCRWVSANGPGASQHCSEYAYVANRPTRFVLRYGLQVPQALSRSRDYSRRGSLPYDAVHIDTSLGPRAHGGDDIQYYPVSIPRGIKCGDFFGAIPVVGGMCLGIKCPKTHPICFQRVIGGVPYAYCFRCFGDLLCPAPCVCVPTIGRGVIGNILPGCKCLTPVEDAERGLPI